MTHELKITIKAEWIPVAPSTATAAIPVAAIPVHLTHTVGASAVLPNTCSPLAHVTEEFATYVLSMLAGRAGVPVRKNSLDTVIKDVATPFKKPIYEHSSSITIERAIEFADRAPIMKCAHILFTKYKAQDENGYLIFLRSKQNNFVIGMLLYSNPSLNPNADDVISSHCHTYGKNPIVRGLPKITMLAHIFQGEDDNYELYSPLPAAAAATASTAAAASAKPVGLESKIKDLIAKSGKQISIYEQSEHLQLSDVFKYADKASIVHCCQGLGTEGPGYMIFVTTNTGTGNVHGFYLCPRANSEDVLSHFIFSKELQMPKGTTMNQLHWEKWPKIFAGSGAAYALYSPPPAAATAASTAVAAAKK